MGAPLRQLILLAMGLALAGPVLGSPAKRQEREVIPGPGFPSLKSLGLTSADLFNATFVDELFKDLQGPPSSKRGPQPSDETEPAGALSRRWTNRCNSGPYGVEGGVRACAGYLRALGTKECRASNAGTVMCSATTAGSEARVRGISIKVGDATSHCRDAAEGVYWAANECVAGCENNQCYVAGSAAAAGNGDLIMISDGNYT